MECRECRRLIPDYMAGILSGQQHTDITGHLNHCAHCREVLSTYQDLDSLIGMGDIEVPVVELTGSIMAVIQGSAENVTKVPPAKKVSRKRTFSLVQDLVAAAAAAIIIFWVSGPFLAGGQSPGYTQEVVKISGSVGGAFQAYVRVSTSALDKITDSINNLEFSHFERR